METSLTLKLQLAPAHQKVWIFNIEKYILSEIENPNLTVGDIAFNFALSERQFYRRVKKILDLSPNLLIRNIKMEVALSLLEEGKIESVKELSFAVGYKRSDYFSNIFFQFYGRRPIDYLHPCIL